MAKANFEKLRVYKQSLKLVDLVYKQIKHFPNSEKYALTDQLKRAVISVPLNIAEGQGRKTRKDNKQFLVIARGSLYEILATLDIAHNQKYISKDIRQEIRNQVFNVLRQLNSLINYFAS